MIQIKAFEEYCPLWCYLFQRILEFFQFRNCELLRTKDPFLTTIRCGRQAFSVLYVRSRPNILMMQRCATGHSTHYFLSPVALSAWRKIDKLMYNLLKHWNSLLIYTFVGLWIWDNVEDSNVSNTYICTCWIVAARQWRWSSVEIRIWQKRRIEELTRTTTNSKPVWYLCGNCNVKNLIYATINWNVLPFYTYTDLVMNDEAIWDL